MADELSKKLADQAIANLSQQWRDLVHNFTVGLDVAPAAPTLLSESESLTVLIEAMRTSAQDTLAALTRAGYCLARK